MDPGNLANLSNCQGCCRFCEQGTERITWSGVASGTDQNSNSVDQFQRGPKSFLDNKADQQGTDNKWNLQIMK